MKTLGLFLFMTVGVFTGSKHYFNKESITSVEIERINSRIDDIKNMIDTDHNTIPKLLFW